MLFVECVHSPSQQLVVVVVVVVGLFVGAPLSILGNTAPDTT